MEILKSIIKDKVTQQKELKNQRRTVRLCGARKVDPHEAAYRHAENRVQLRYLYCAYAIIRGKDPVLAVGAYAGYLSQTKVVKELVEKYGLVRVD